MGKRPTLTMYPYYNPSNPTCASIDWKFGRLEAWKFGGAQEVEARAVAYGDDVTSRCAAITKDTKNHKGTQRLPVWETADSDEHREHREDRGAQRRAACYRRQDCQFVFEYRGHRGV